jgi:hypothetical protein
MRVAARRRTETTVAFGLMEDVLEPISPELVLVDPTLAERLRERWIARAEVEHEPLAVSVERPREPAPPRPAPLPPAASSHAIARRGRRRATDAVLVLSLLANAFFVVTALSESSAGQRPAQLADVSRTPTRQADATGGSRRSLRQPKRQTSTEAADARTKPPSQRGNVSTTATSEASGAEKPRAHPTPASAQRAAPRRTRRPARLLGRKAMIERKLLALLILSPLDKLPSALIDSDTGLARNNLQAVCTRRDPRSFACVVRPAEAPSRYTVRALYRIETSGRGHFSWQTG